ncbi:MAG: glycosyl transferase family 25 [Verrucomicrobiales bacterium]|jgi:glycosyl transferase family 25
MRAYIINLDSEKERWAFTEEMFAQTNFEVCRIPGVDGRQLEFPMEEYSEGLYRWFHGRSTNPGHVGCYLSHVKAIEAFLETDDQHALIGEDDVVLGADFEKVIESALKHSQHWNVMRLTGLGNGHPMKVADLGNGYSLSVSLGRLKGTGAYLIDRETAKKWVKGLLPMRMPIDHAVDREWFFGLRGAYVTPWPASQTDTDFASAIQKRGPLKLGPLRRWVATYPYQAWNECTRYLCRWLSALRIKAAIAADRGQ